MRMPPDPPGVKTHARIEKVGARYRATLEIESSRSRGERVLEADSCEALARSAAVVVAMAATPERNDEAPAGRDEPVPMPAPAPASPAPTAPDERTPTPKRQGEAPARVALRAEAAADGATLPAVTFGAGVAVGLRVSDRVRLEARGAVFAEQLGRVDAVRGARFSLFSAGARACWSLTSSVEIAPCAGLDVSAVGATGFGAQRAYDGTAIVLAPEALLAFRAPLAGRVALTASAGVVVPLWRESFVITGRGTIHEVPAIAVRAFAGPEVHF